MLFDAKDTILFIGDSIGDYDRGRPVGDWWGNWGASYVADIATLLQATYPENRYRVLNVCVGGEQSRHLVNRWQKDVLDRNPDWVCILIGINDVWRHFDCPDRPETWYGLEDYTQAVEKMITDTLPHVKGMILMTPFFMEPNKQDSMRIRMDEYGAIVKKLAEKHGLIFVDLQSAWDRLFEHMHPCNIAWDRIHPNQIGCMYIAKQFLQAIGADRA